MATLLDWNGKELPPALRALPTGRYVIEPVDRVLDLTAEQEEGLEAAARSLDAGQGLSLDAVRKRLTFEKTVVHPPIVPQRNG
jgi:hypothetical protein